MKYFLLILALCWGSAHAQKKDRPYVILVSFDGFRHDYVSNYDLPNFKSFIKKGASSEGLIPSFPSKTFPNHYTIVTGLYPGNHGLVDNSFYDKATGKVFTTGKRDMVENPDFYGGTPLWQLAQQQGVLSASYFWVGSEAPVQGWHPAYYSIYDHEFPNENRIDSVLYWLGLPQDKRPNFITLYFSLVDDQGHNVGPNSIELGKTLHTADSLLGYLMSGLKKINLPVNVILVSDHGMTELKREEKIWITLSDYINTADSSLILVNSGTHVHLYTFNRDSVYRALKAKEKNFTVYKKDLMPSKWHYNHERVGDVLILANPGFQLQITHRKRDLSRPGTTVFGNHGFDPYVMKDMYGIFYAMGPNIKPGKRIPSFDNIHIYPFIAKILDLSIPKVDGDIRVLEGLYKK